jgi:hypothetical protein
LKVEEDLDLLQRFDSAVRRSFVNGLPLHVSDPVNSAFCAMTKVEFERKAVGEIQGIMRRRHILITDMDSPALDFDPRGLSSLTTLSTVTDIQGE